MVAALLAAPARLGAVRVLAIDGPSGAGKSTLAAAVLTELGHRSVRSLLISTDEFATWSEPVAWWPRLADGVLTPFARGRAGSYRQVDWTTEGPRPGAEITVAPPEVLVLEGVSAGRASIRPRLSLLCWVPGPGEQARLDRAVHRDGEQYRERLREWQAFERGWFAVDQTSRRADRTIGVVDLVQER
nr:uridine kinase [Amycolatopsis nigrescens]